MNNFNLICGRRFMVKEFLLYYGVVTTIPIWQGYHHHHFYYAIKNPFNTGTVANAFELIGNGIWTNFTECTKWSPNFINIYYNYSFFVTFSCLSKKKKFIFEITVVDMVNVKTRSIIIYLFIFTLCIRI